MTIKEELDSLIQDYGYINKFPDPKKLVGRASEQIEYMAIQPKPGKKEELRAAAARIGVMLNDDNLKMPDGITKEAVLIFPTRFQSEFREMVREVVKSRGSK